MLIAGRRHCSLSACNKPAAVADVTAMLATGGAWAPVAARYRLIAALTSRSCRTPRTMKVRSLLCEVKLGMAPVKG
jgi:hypothetical protein